MFKTMMPLLILLLLTVSCQTAPLDQKAGQGDNHAVATTWNSKATLEGNAYDGTVVGAGLHGGALPVYNKDGTLAKNPDGSQIFMVPPRGVRDLNWFFGEVVNESSVVQSGSTEGTSQGQTSSPTSETTPTLSVPVQ